MSLNHEVVVMAACGSRDSQTLCLCESGAVYSWGDGDFGKLGRGGSEGCNVPRPIDKLIGKNIVKICKFATVKKMCSCKGC